MSRPLVEGRLAQSYAAHVTIGDSTLSIGPTSPMNNSSVINLDDIAYVVKDQSESALKVVAYPRKQDKRRQVGMGCICLAPPSTQRQSSNTERDSENARRQRRGIVPDSQCRVRQTVSIGVDDLGELDALHDDICRAAGLPLSNSRYLLVLINPVSGAGKSVQQYDRFIEPELTESGYFPQLSSVILSQPGEAMDRGESAIGAFDTVLCIGGDGVVHEAISGFVSARDSGEPSGPRAEDHPTREGYDPTDVTFVPFPAGSGNGLISSIQFCAGERMCDVYSVLLALFRGKTMSIPVVTVTKPQSVMTRPQSGKTGKSGSSQGEPMRDTVHSTSQVEPTTGPGPNTRVLCVGLSFGLISDIDKESECLRFLGGARFDAYAAFRVPFYRKYSATIEFRECGRTSTVTKLHFDGKKTWLYFLWLVRIPALTPSTFVDSTLDLTGNEMTLLYAHGPECGLFDLIGKLGALKTPEASRALLEKPTKGIVVKRVSSLHLKVHSEAGKPLRGAGIGIDGEYGWLQDECKVEFSPEKSVKLIDF